MRQEPPLPPSTPVATDGSFELSLAPGKYRVVLYDEASHWLGQLRDVEAVEGRSTVVELTDDRP